MYYGKRKSISEEIILELYGDYVLNHGEKPKNIYRFAKDNEFEKKNFYDYFASFEQIEKQMLVNLFLKSVELAAEVNEAEEITSKEKLLNV
ncbi:hypothetical protein IX39_17815 [Chryseobacterium formosense]|uniref:TetR family transcriptional regulator n=1 Tax=Chryseobacterium formosense TaxID=236814 RepID=A0A085Z1D1_9FLAO|nr:hypothetical protein [Chryseobacterium formosense]KFE98244.1 hypothetical protein IX39_17815 [Chryseobacterium formosense]SFT74707.1 hypothetical protein SAMN05421857_2968 [Chryseobacterium formosense]